MTEKRVRADLREARRLYKMRKYKEVEAIKAKYADAISSLNAIEKEIVIKGIIGGLHYWQVGRRNGYAEQSIKNLARSAIQKIAARMQ